MGIMHTKKKGTIAFLYTNGEKGVNVKIIRKKK